MKKTVQRRILWRLVGAGSALLAGQAMKFGLRKGYKTARGSLPPTTPGQKGTSLQSALMWTAFSAVAISLSEVLAEQAAAKGWRKATGKQPPK